MPKKKESVLTKEWLLQKAKSLATPIDFDDLIEKGILEKKGARYRILDMKRLPEHAADKIIKISSDGFVKFSTGTKKAERLVKKLSE